YVPVSGTVEGAVPFARYDSLATPHDESTFQNEQIELLRGRAVHDAAMELLYAVHPDVSPGFLAMLEQSSGARRPSKPPRSAAQRLAAANAPGSRQSQSDKAIDPTGEPTGEVADG